MTAKLWQFLYSYLEKIDNALFRKLTSGYLLLTLSYAWRTARVSARIILWGVVLIFLIPFVIGYFVLSTPRDISYRDLHPYLPSCRAGLTSGWTVLAKLDNDETIAIRREKKWADLFRCALQRHVIPAASAGKKSVDFHLAFLEFKESGEPYALAKLEDGKVAAITYSDLKRLVPEGNTDFPPMTQLDVLVRHLRQGSHFVIVFTHGWRHDASIGDTNVADLRHHAAHAVRFLAQRCESHNAYCDTKVTAVYIGWRGARVNEAGLRRWLGQWLGGSLAALATVTTLFDRKPVSEQVAHGVTSSLRALEKALSYGGRENRMIVFGHSLGGNILATGLRDDVIKLVRRHKPGNLLPPVLGNLVVLINPAAEAAKWTAIQREVWSRIAYYANGATSDDEVVDGHKFFPAAQKPVLLSMTAAAAFPPGGLRDADCRWLEADVDDGSKRGRQSINKAVKANKGLFDAGIDYDKSTHWLFPAFKFDFRPMSLWLDRQVARLQNRSPKRHTCDNATSTTIWGWIRSVPLRILSRVLREFPFQNTDQEFSRTIGHLNPPRPSDGYLVNKQRVSTAPFGTSHEIYGVSRAGLSGTKKYADLADVALDCPRANQWLSRARMAQTNGTNWDSSILAATEGGTEGVERPAAHFLHGINLGGQQPITRANDPFWNMRAFDNILARHDGYRFATFICAMNQLVLDDITGLVAVRKIATDSAR